MIEKLNICIRNKKKQNMIPIPAVAYILETFNALAKLEG